MNILPLRLEICSLMDDTFLPGKEKWSRRTGYPLIMIRGAAHNANDDQPDIVNGIVLDFIKNNGYNRRTNSPLRTDTARQRLHSTLIMPSAFLNPINWVPQFGQYQENGYQVSLHPVSIRQIRERLALP